MSRLVFAVAVLGGLVAVAAPVPKEYEWVTVRGRVLWPLTAEVPALELVRAKCCQVEGEPFVDDRLIVSPRNKGLKNVVVWLRPDSQDIKAQFPKDRIHPDLARAKPVEHVVEMVRCQFVPRVFVARAGDAITFRSSPVEPHALRYDSATVSHNRLIPAGEKFQAEDPLSAHDRPVLLSCGLHQFKEGYGMRGSGRVFDHPYYAITNSDGSFEMAQVPKGNWRIVYWHEAIGYHKRADGRLGFPLRVPGRAATLEMKDLEIDVPLK